ncbi:hypothetical protein ACKKBH_03745 [Aeromonas dhakensis]|jgi:hypothetical protein|uniref:hypothetical protein n=1 Tax=Aeromonas dhakensis TaxID=196024 RepID=UPI0038F74129|nr:hypothetical protein [Aeromonas bestiarum]
MRFLRLPIKDPRTVARDIPGIFDIIFPQLTPGIIAHINNSLESIPVIERIPDSMIKKTSITPAMLFEIAYAKAEYILKGNVDVTLESCLQAALSRQSRYFDAVLPDSLSTIEITVANNTSDNIVKSLEFLQKKIGNEPISIGPSISGYSWISKGEGDFSISDTLIELKCGASKFSSSDIRQILIYWLLSYAASLEKNEKEWSHGILLNPRLNLYTSFNFNELAKILSGGRSKIEILQIFDHLIKSHESKNLLY